MNEARYAINSIRSMIKIMNEFSFMKLSFREHLKMNFLSMLSNELSQSSCSLLQKSSVSPYRNFELHSFNLAFAV
jgi:hypothetical protein